MRRRLAMLVLVVAAAWPAPALAGGSNVSVAAAGGQVWVATGQSVVELDAGTGRAERRFHTRYPFTLDLRLSRNAVWVSSVEDGFVAGGVTRIPLPAGRVTHPLVLPARPVFTLAAGAGTTWAVVGPWPSTQLAAIDQATGRATLEPVARIGRIAADPTGRIPGLYGITLGGRALRIGRDGTARWTATTGRLESGPLVAMGSIWAATRTRLYRLDPLTGHVQATIPLGTLATHLAAGGGRIWIAGFRQHGTPPDELLEVDARTNRLVAQVPVAGPVGAIAYGMGAVWLGEAGATVSLLRVDPATLQARVVARDLDLG